MSRSHYFYTLLSLNELQRVVEEYQQEFDALLGDTFSESELKQFETQIDNIGSVTYQPILTELSFDDFYANPSEEEAQRAFFNRCKSSLCIENLPYFESNPFQVTYLTNLVWSFEEVLIDQGGVKELTFRKGYLEELKKFKNMDSFVSLEKPEIAKPSIKSGPVEPIDFLILDVSKEISRLKNYHLFEKAKADVVNLSEKAQKAFTAVLTGELDATALLKASGLNAKDFDDNLEKIKFWLRKIL